MARYWGFSYNGQSAIVESVFQSRGKNDSGEELEHISGKNYYWSWKQGVFTVSNAKVVDGSLVSGTVTEVSTFGGTLTQGTGLMSVARVKHGFGSEAATKAFLFRGDDRVFLSELYDLDEGDRFHGMGGDDRIQGGGQDDVIFGNGGNDRILGAGGDDFVHGNGGADRLIGDSGYDRIFGGNGNDVIAGGKQNDRLAGNGGNDDIAGGDGSDTLFGGRGSDGLAGGEHRDVLYGGAGRDRLTGGLGPDVLHGNAGADTFVFSVGFGKDRIVDFQPGMPGDKIDVREVPAIENWRDLVANHLETGKHGLVIEVGQHSIELLGIQRGQLQPNDFLF